MKNLFFGWPKNRLAMVYYDNYDYDSNDKSICTNYYGLGNKEKKFIWPVSKLVKNQQKKQGPKSDNHLSGNRKLLLYNAVVSLLGGDEIIRKYAVSPELTKWIEDFKPELIYCHISSLNQIIFVKKVQSYCNIPIAIHIMDDWFNVRYKKGLFAPVLRNLFFRKFKELLKLSTSRMGIGRKMSDSYERLFGYSFVPFSNTVVTQNWFRRERRYKNDGTFLIIYAVTINTKNLCGLELMSKIVEKLNSQWHKIQFKIFTFQPRVEQYRSTYEAPPSVTMDEVPDNDQGMAELFGSADLLFLPVDFTPESINRMRYSIFAKIPAYMASGTPILFFSPSEIASAEYALKDNWAYMVNDNDENLLKQGLEELMADSDLREKIGANANRIARRDFESSKIRESFRKALSKAAGL